VGEGEEVVALVIVCGDGLGIEGVDVGVVGVLGVDS